MHRAALVDGIDLPGRVGIDLDDVGPDDLGFGRAVERIALEAGRHVDQIRLAVRADRDGLDAVEIARHGERPAPCLQRFPARLLVPIAPHARIADARHDGGQETVLRAPADRPRGKACQGARDPARAEVEATEACPGGHPDVVAVDVNVQRFGAGQVAGAGADGRRSASVGREDDHARVRAIGDEHASVVRDVQPCRRVELPRSRAGSAPDRCRRSVRREPAHDVAVAIADGHPPIGRRDRDPGHPADPGPRRDRRSIEAVDRDLRPARVGDVEPIARFVGGEMARGREAAGNQGYG